MKVWNKLSTDCVHANSVNNVQEQNRSISCKGGYTSNIFGFSIWLPCLGPSMLFLGCQSYYVCPPRREVNVAKL